MECNPGTFERIAETKPFDVKPVVLVKCDLKLVRYAFSEEVLQQTARSSDIHDTTVQ